ncbi:signal transduction histidine kinase [Actinomycetospora succinea]|uniref:histidine kinase n=1 Tax=Actinomycetospora succinea TaxID=663603 RepID=A0A4R6USC5_9PSEU|nr:ATP-binding protein [Actinomycetospora succinea]TDQ50120.1 signal transduction histidine kinase [Actinomycetospora succinea]
MTRVMDYLPRGDMVDDAAWQRRHHFLLAVLVSLAPLLLVFGLVVGNSLLFAGLVALVPLLTAAGGRFVPGRLAGEIFVSAGLSASCAGLVILSGGYIEAHFSFFVIIGFLMLYQSWVPFAVNIVFTTLSHGLGTLLVPTLFFNHHAAQHNPWAWALIHGFAVLLACAGVAIFVKITEDEQRRRIELTKELHDQKVRQQEFTSELLLNLARRNQTMFHRQLDIINDLEERERDPDALADLFRLDHLATRVRRNAESLLVLSGEQPARVWSAPVALRDVVRAGVAETEDLDRVTLAVDERQRLVGSTVADLTHMIAELVENAARYSPPSAPVVIQSRSYHRSPGAHLLVVEDTGIGMPPAELAAANELLAHPQGADVSAAARRLGFHVVARLAQRHGIEVSLTPTPGCGLTAVLLLPAALFAEATPTVPVVGDSGLERVPASAVPVPRRGSADAGGPAPTWGHAAPASGPLPANGRHAWPGREAPDRGNGNGDTPAGGTGGRRRSAHAAPGADDEVAVPEKGEKAEQAEQADAGDPHATVEDVPAADAAAPARRGLIHPIVVPPPAPAEQEEGGIPAGAPAPRRSDEDVPAPVGPNGLVLARRRPQSHLAPELIRRTPGIPAATPVSAAHAATASPDAGRPDADRPERPPAGRGAMDALSAYQASRAAARSAISDDGDGTPASDDHPQRGSTPGRQT